MQDERRVVLMLTGLASTRERAIESERLLSWAFREFSEQTLFKAGDVISQAEVWLGDADLVDLVPDADISVLVPYATRNEMTAEVVYSGPVDAPFEKGAVLAELVIGVPGLAPLYAGTAVARGGFVDRMFASARILGKKIIDAAQSNAQ